MDQWVDEKLAGMHKVFYKSQRHTMQVRKVTLNGDLGGTYESGPGPKIFWGQELI